MKKLLSFLLALSMVLSCLSMVTLVTNAEGIEAQANALKIQGTDSTATYTIINQADGLFNGVEFAESETTKNLNFTLYNTGTTSLAFTIRIAEGWTQNLYVGATNYYNKGVSVSIAPGTHQEISITIPKTYSLSNGGEATQSYTNLGLRFYWPRALTADDVIYLVPEDKTIVDNYVNSYGVNPVKEDFEIPKPIAVKISGNSSDNTIIKGAFEGVEVQEGAATTTARFAVYSKNAITLSQFYAVDEWEQCTYSEPGKVRDGVYSYTSATLASGEVKIVKLTVPTTYYLPNAAEDEGKNCTEYDIRIAYNRAITTDDAIYIAPLHGDDVLDWERVYGPAFEKVWSTPFEIIDPDATPIPTPTPTPIPTPVSVGAKLEVITALDAGYAYYYVSGKLTKAMAVDGKITKNFVIYNTTEADIMVQAYYMDAGWATVGATLKTATIKAGNKGTVTVEVPCDEKGTYDGTHGVDTMLLRFNVFANKAGDAIIIATENNEEVESLKYAGVAGGATTGRGAVSIVNTLPGQATPTPEETPTPEVTSEYVGKKITFISDVKNTLLTGETAGISGLSDGNHTISYLVYNKGNVDVDVKVFLLNGTETYNENDGTVVTIPKNEARYVTYDFVVEGGLIKGTTSSGAQKDAVLAVNVAMSETSSNGIGMIPAGTEVTIAYNRFDDKDAAKTLNDEHPATEVEDVKKLPAIGKKLTANVLTENNYWYVRANAEMTSFIDGTHKVGYYVYNPNNFAVSVNFYLQNDYATVNNNIGTSKILEPHERAYFTYEYTVTDGKYFDADASKMTIRFDVRPANGETSLPKDTSIYVQYEGAPNKDPLKNIKSILVGGASVSATISDMVFCPDYKPTAVIYTSSTTATTPYFLIGYPNGLFTKDDVKDGKLVFEQYVFNESDYDITFYPAYHTSTSAGWEGYKSGDLMTVEKNSGAWLKASYAVNADNTITIGSANYPIESFFLRLYFHGEITAGTVLIFTTDEERSDKMLSATSSAGFKAKATYDTKYTAPDTVADPTFHISSAFGSHMVLQRNAKVPVWGVSTYIGETVTVTFKGQEKTAIVTEDGKWTVTFDSMPADKTPAELTATCNGKTEVLTDILVGDVFIIGGQSNADMALANSGTTYSNAYKQQLIDSAEGNIRFFRQGKLDAMKVPETMNAPQYEPINGNVWTRETFGTANSFCAFGFFFGHALYNEIDVPIGMIMAASAGSPLSQLMSKEAADATGYDRYESGIPVSGMYNALMNPFINMSFKGMLFFQGESEHALAKTDYGKYNEYLNAYVEDLREKNGNDFPFYYAQVGTYPGLNFTGIGEQRAVQFEGLKVINNSGMIVTMDMGARADYHDTAHSPYKEPIGQRFADLVLAKTYGIADENYVVSPIAQYATKTADGIVVTFKNVGDGLKRIGEHETLSGFRAMTGPATYVNVAATILSDNTVLVHTNGIEGVIGVAYGVENICYTNYPEGNGDLTCVANLGNSVDLPAFSFKMLVEDKIVGAQTNVGKDLTLNMHSTAQGQMKVYHDGKEIIIDGAYNEASGSYVYMYEGINPQCMGDKLDMQLWVGGEMVDEKAEYSIKEYCNNLVNGEKPEGYTEEQFAALKTMLADMLDFGAEAQKHMGYKTDALMNDLSWVQENRSTFVKPESVKAVTETTNADYSFRSMGLHVSNYISIYVKFNVKDWTNVTVKVGDKIYTEADLENGTLYLEDLSATRYSEVFNIELQVNGTTVQTLTYSANSYIASKYNGAQSALVQAIGRYGAAAEKLVSLQ